MPPGAGHRIRRHRTLQRGLLRGRHHHPPRHAPGQPALLQTGHDVLGQAGRFPGGPVGHAAAEPGGNGLRRRAWRTRGPHGANEGAALLSRAVPAGVRRRDDFARTDAERPCAVHAPHRVGEQPLGCRVREGVRCRLARQGSQARHSGLHRTGKPRASPVHGASGPRRPELRGLPCAAVICACRCRRQRAGCRRDGGLQIALAQGCGEILRVHARRAFCEPGRGCGTLQQRGEGRPRWTSA